MIKRIGKYDLLCKVVCTLVMILGFDLIFHSVVLAASAENEPNGDYSSASELTINNTVSGIISGKEDVDYYKLTLSAPSSISFSLKLDESLSSSSYFYASIYDENENKLLYREIVKVGDGLETANYYLGIGTYFLKVWNGFDDKDYKYSITVHGEPITEDSIEIENNDSSVNANVIALEQKEHGQLSHEGDIDWYKISIPKTGTISIVFDHSYYNYDAFISTFSHWNLSLYADSDLQNSCYSIDYKPINSCEQKSEFVSVNPGTYYICIKKADWFSPVDYGIVINFKETTDDNNTSSKRNEIQFNTNIYGSINNSGTATNFWERYNDYIFTPQKPGKIYITLTPNKTSYGLGLDLYLCSDSGNLSGGGYSTNAYNKSICTAEYYVAGGEDYLIHVSYGKEGTCSYTLKVNYVECTDLMETEPNNAYENAKKIEIGNRYEGGVSFAGDVDYYQFDIEKAGNIYFTFGSKSTRTYFEVYNDDKKLILSETIEVWAWQSNEIFVEPGKYYVKFTKDMLTTSRDAYYFQVDYFQADNDNSYVDFRDYVAPEGCVYQFRLYNPNSGEHFYTGSQEETINLVKAGWNFEGSGFITPTVGIPIYRLYSAEHGDHFYTTSEIERDALLADHWTLDGDTGIAFPSASSETGRPMYRLYNPNAYPNGEAGAHHFTMSWEEVENLQAEGWQYEFIAWYSV